MENAEDDVCSLLELVNDRDSFIRFVRALAEERDLASQMEKQNPTLGVVGGSMGWENGDIPSFLLACLQYFSPGPLDKRDVPSTPTWKAWAEFLWVGKIYE